MLRCFFKPRVGSLVFSVVPVSSLSLHSKCCLFWLSKACQNSGPHFSRCCCSNFWDPQFLCPPHTMSCHTAPGPVTLQPKSFSSSHCHRDFSCCCQSLGFFQHLAEVSNHFLFFIDLTFFILVPMPQCSAVDFHFSLSCGLHTLHVATHSGGIQVI